MSFSGKVKEELAGQFSPARHCQVAEMAALLCGCGHVEKMSDGNIKLWIQTENEAFQKRFQVYAEDEHNAYYILTPQRMEKIMEFADAVEGQISLVFYDEKLFAAVKRESMFDAVMDEPVSKQTEYILEDADFIQKAKGILIVS